MEKEFENNSMNNENIELKLWEYIDGLTEGTERSSIEKLIRENAKWKIKYKELLEVHQLMQSTELEEPSMRFTKNVMEDIAKLQIAPAAKKYINNKIVWGIGFFFVSMIIAFLVFGILQIDWNAAGDSDSTLGVDMNKVDFGKMFDNNIVNIFMMLNIVLGLFLLDRFLNNKKKNLVKE